MAGGINREGAAPTRRLLTRDDRGCHKAFGGVVVHRRSRIGGRRWADRVVTLRERGARIDARTEAAAHESRVDGATGRAGVVAQKRAS